MSETQKIREDIYEVYRLFKIMGEISGAEDLFSAKLLKKLSYTDEAVKEVLNLMPKETAKDLPVVPKKIKDKKSISSKENIANNITDLESLRKFYYSEMIKLFDPNEEKGVQANLEKQLKVKDLKQLYQLIFQTTLPTKINKKDLLQRFKNFFDDEARTEDMNMKLMGKR